MPGLRDTLAFLKRHKAPVTPQSLAGLAPTRMSEVHGFGLDPGALRMLVYIPNGIAPRSPLVVVLHGCTQTGEGYAHGAGWLDLADRCGFAVLAPEQTRANNPNLCFNWFQPGDVARGAGEAQSIRSMIARAVADHDLDPTRVFITGLSAGGAMTAAMLAAYPETFAAGAVVAGLPAGAAANVQGAFAAMAAASPLDDAQLTGAVRAASPHQGPWPRVSIWHGDADATVRYGNADALAAQWSGVHGLADSEADTLAGHPRRTWRDNDGGALVELVTLTGMGHGTPLAVGGEGGCGQAGPFLIEIGLSSSREIARFWGLTPLQTPLSPKAPTPPPPPHRFDPGSVITKALRAAGLMK